MGRNSGGIRGGSKKRLYEINKIISQRIEFNALINSGEYDIKRSYFDAKSGGFVVTHNEHNKIKDKNKDKSDIASKILAQNGYKVYLDSEKSTHNYEKRRDGRLNNDAMDIKTINNIGKYTLKSALESAASQKSKLCIVFENTKKMEDNYIIHQIELYRKYLRDKDSKVEQLIVVNNGGNIKHFHI